MKPVQNSTSVCDATKAICILTISLAKTKFTVKLPKKEEEVSSNKQKAKISALIHTYAEVWVTFSQLIFGSGCTAAPGTGIKF